VPKAIKGGENLHHIQVRGMFKGISVNSDSLIFKANFLRVLNPEIVIMGYA
jgi:hypothetical protein